MKQMHVFSSLHKSNTYDTDMADLYDKEIGLKLYPEI